MGCVFSKHFKQQASMDGRTSPSSRPTAPRAKTIAANYSVECYHRHFVSLTSSSYGSLKVESPKPAEVRLTHDQASALTSLNQMYGKLRSLEMADSAYINPSRDINSNMQNTFQSCAHKSPWQLDANHLRSKLASSEMMDSAHIDPPQLEENQQRSIDSAESVLPETINVKEMMMGLEEVAPFHCSSVTTQAPSALGTPNTKTLKQSRYLKKKANATEHTIRVKNRLITAIEWSDDDDEIGKENNSPFYGQKHIHPPPKSATSTRSPMGNTPLSHSSYKSASSAWCPASHSPLFKPPQSASKSSASMKSPVTNPERTGEFQPIRRESIVARRTQVKTGSSPCSGIQSSKMSSPGLSSTSSASVRSLQYAPSNGKVKLTLQAQPCNGATTVLGPSNASRPMPRQVGFASAESSSPTFDPDLVASYEKALRRIPQGDWNTRHANISKGNQYSPTTTTKADVSFIWPMKSKPKTDLDKTLYDPLQCFKVKCPPGGEKAVVLYTTTLRGIRKTFEDCNTARDILQSFGLSIDERDVSMHLDFLNELRELMDRVVSVPRMFIKGRYIGGIEEIVKLHEDGKLGELVEGLPKQINGGNCDGCGGVRFVPCLECSGSCKLRSEEDNTVTRCPDCNENGLIQCPICT